MTHTETISHQCELGYVGPLNRLLCNHRTRREDLDLLVREVLRLGDQLTA